MTKKKKKKKETSFKAIITIGYKNLFGFQVDYMLKV